MNNIYKKLKPKRKYKRTPKCANLAGVCTWEKCRCNYPLMEPETKAKIDEYLHHRQKVIKRKREVELQKLDNEIEDIIAKDYVNYNFVGAYRKQKIKQEKYEKLCWKVLWGLCALLLIISLII